MLPRFLALWLLPRAPQLGGALRRALQRSIDEDAVVGAAARALAVVERPRDGGLSGAQKDRLLAALLDDRAGDPVEPASAPAWRALVPLAAAGACVGVFAVSSNGDLAARGAADAALGVRVRCVHDGAVVDDASAGARQTGGDLACPAGSLLAFSTTNLQRAERFAFVVGIDDHGDVVWLPPFAEDSAARALPAGSTDAVVDTLAPLPDRAVTLFVLLDDNGFDGADVGRRLDAARRSGVPLEKLDKLPVGVRAQGRLLLRPLEPR